MNEIELGNTTEEKDEEKHSTTISVVIKCLYSVHSFNKCRGFRDTDWILWIPWISLLGRPSVMLHDICTYDSAL